MTEQPVPGRGFVTRRAIAEIARQAAIGSYGVVDVSGPGPFSRLRSWLGRGTPGVRVTLVPMLRIDIHLTVAFGVPIAEVARNVDDAVRFRLRQAIGREVDQLAIHVDGLRVDPGRRELEKPGTAESSGPSAQPARPSPQPARPSPQPARPPAEDAAPAPEARTVRG